MVDMVVHRAPSMRATPARRHAADAVLDRSAPGRAGDAATRPSAPTGASACTAMRRRFSTRLLALASQADRSVARPHRSGCWRRWAIPNAGCRRSSMSPAPTARARPSPLRAPSWRRPAKRVHVYTSPHLVRFNERIRLAAPGGGRWSRTRARRARSTRCETVNAGAARSPFSRSTTAAAFMLFARHSGRCAAARSRARRRSTRPMSIEQPAATVITPVSHRPCRFSRRHASRRSPAKRPASSSAACRWSWPRKATRRWRCIEREAARLGAPLLVVGQDFLCRAEHGRLVYRGRARPARPAAAATARPPPVRQRRRRHRRAAGDRCPRSDRRGVRSRHRQRRLAGAAAAAARRARWSRCGAAQAREIWLDGGHNEAGGRVAAPRPWPISRTRRRGRWS